MESALHHNSDPSLRSEKRDASFYHSQLFNELYFLADGGSVWLNSTNAIANTPSLDTLSTTTGTTTNTHGTGTASFYEAVKAIDMRIHVGRESIVSTANTTGGGGGAGGARVSGKLHESKCIHIVYKDIYVCVCVF